MFKVFYNILKEKTYRLKNNDYIIPYIDWSKINYYWDSEKQIWIKKDEKN